MLILFFLFYCLLNVEAASRTEKESNSTLTQRTLFGIVWSCVSTIIICAWTSVHPNVPPPNPWKARWNRLRLMFWMIIAPELVLAWAVRQFFAAKEIRNEYNARYPDLPEWEKWTLMHGHFLEMGGFTLVDPERKTAPPNERQQTVLTLEYFKAHPDIEIPTITAAAIEDKLKGDALSKVIAILQTTWFIVQCIARGQQRLALTELELVTLALASLNAVTFAIWWHKPLGVQDPVQIYIYTEMVEQVNDEVPENLEKISFSDVIYNCWGFLKQPASLVLPFVSDPCDEGVGAFIIFIFLFLPLFLIVIFTLPVFMLFPLGTVLLLKVINTNPTPKDAPLQGRGLLASRMVASLQTFRYWLTSAVSKFVANRMAEMFDGDFFLGVPYVLLPLLFLFLTLFVIFLIPFFTLVFLLSFIFTAAFGIVTTSDIRPGASYVPSFYAPSTQSDRWSRMVVFAFFGVIFGGLHCIGWNFEFPTHAEQMLWRSTSLGIAAIPLIVAPIDFLLALRLRIRDINSCPIFEKGALLILDFVVTFLLFVYVPARLSLIAQALALLRSQPASALTAVDWTKYVPHLFSS